MKAKAIAEQNFLRRRTSARMTSIQHQFPDIGNEILFVRGMWVQMPGGVQECLHLMGTHVLIENKMADNTIKVTVLEGVSASLSALGLPLPVCLQQLSAL